MNEKKERLLSLDVFRGITIFAMIVVNNQGSGDHMYTPLKHSTWNGCTPTDLIFPFFLFMVGVTTVFSLEKYRDNNQSNKEVITRILKRSLILFGLGLIINGFPHFNLTTLRIPGVLQRIALVYFFTSLLFLNVKKVNIKWWIIGIVVLNYLIINFIPNPETGKALFELKHNFSAWLDEFLLSGHLYTKTVGNDPEGLFGTLPSIATALIGVTAGYQLKHNSDKINNALLLLAFGAVLTGIGYITDFMTPINKRLWTSSYVIYTGGLALTSLGLCYWIIDIKKIAWWIKPFHIFGTNAIFAYFLSSIGEAIVEMISLDVNGTTLTLKEAIYHFLASIVSPNNASVIYSLLYTCFWMLITWFLYRKKIFLKV